MNDFQNQLDQFPTEIKSALNVGFVFVREKEHYWHFPARQWTDKQIQNYFFNRYSQESSFTAYPELGLKQLIIQNLPALFIVVPYKR